jgi:hypothetical protein
MKMAWTCAHLGEVAGAFGDHTAARAHLEESLAIFREFGRPWECAYVLDKLGRVAQHQGQWQAARAHFSESIAFWQRVENKQGIAACLDGLAAVTAGQGALERAARLYGAAAALRESCKIPLPPVNRADLDHGIAAVRANLGDAAFMAAWSHGQTIPVEQIIAEALQES